MKLRDRGVRVPLVYISGAPIRVTTILGTFWEQLEFVLWKLKTRVGASERGLEVIVTGHLAVDL